MYLVALAWMYVALMMALAEATSSQGSVLGAVFTFVLYGVLPVSIVMYLMGTPLRRAARRKAEQEELSAHRAAVQAASDQADAGGHAAGEGLVAERKEP